MQSDASRSVGERARRVQFGHFTRSRPDDKVVELFLAWWENGRFAPNPDWLPQNVENVEAVASDAAGNRLAIEHTSIYAYDQQQREEDWMSKMAAKIEAAPELQLPGRRLSITFKRDLFDDLNQKKREEYTDGLISWLAKELPDISLGIHRRVIPSLLAGKKPIEIEIELDDFIVGLRPVHVGGMLPEDAIRRAIPQIEHALSAKLPKLSKAKADRKVLLIELPTLDTSPSQILDLIQEWYAAQLGSIDFVVLAKTIAVQANGVVWFFAYDTRNYELGDIGYVTW